MRYACCPAKFPSLSILSIVITPANAGVMETDSARAPNLCKLPGISPGGRASLSKEVPYTAAPAREVGCSPHLEKAFVEGGERVWTKGKAHRKPWSASSQRSGGVVHSFITWTHNYWMPTVHQAPCWVWRVRSKTCPWSSRGHESQKQKIDLQWTKHNDPMTESDRGSESQWETREGGTRARDDENSST